jgi:hypothetical protein
MSEESNSSYLYHPEMRQTYQEVLKTLGNQDCPQARQVMPFLDLSEESRQKRFSGLEGHIENCQVCQREMGRASEMLADVDRMIPRKMVSREVQAAFEADLSSLLRQRRMKEMSRHVDRVRAFGRGSYAVARDLQSVLLTPKTLVIIGITGFFLFFAYR